MLPLSNPFLWLPFLMAALVNLFDSCPCKPFLMAALVKPFMIDTFSNSFYLCRSLFNFYLLKNKNYEKIEFQKAKKKKEKKIRNRNEPHSLLEKLLAKMFVWANLTSPHSEKYCFFSRIFLGMLNQIQISLKWESP